MASKQDQYSSAGAGIGGGGGATFYDPVTGTASTMPTYGTTNNSGASPTRIYPTVVGGTDNEVLGGEAAILTEQQSEETRHELAKTEEEIDTLRRVLQSKIKHANELKRKLGISAWDELTKDVQTGLSSLTDSETYQKAAHSIGNVKERGVDFFSGVTTGITKKMGDLKNTSAFKSFEASAGGIVSQVKARVGTGMTPASEHPPSEFGATTIGVPQYGDSTMTTTTTTSSQNNSASTPTNAVGGTYGATYSSTSATSLGGAGGGVGKTTTTTTTSKVEKSGISTA